MNRKERGKDERKEEEQWQRTHERKGVKE